MGKTLTVAVVTTIALLVAHALFAPVYETGFAQISSPVLFLCFAVPFLGLLLRRQWAWRFASTITGIYPVLHVVFFPTPEFYGAYTLHAQVLVSFGIAISAVTFFLLRREMARAKRVVEAQNDG